MKIKQIVDGWKNVVFTDEQIEELASERQKVCDECEHKLLFMCGVCHCPLAAKTRSPESKCPKEKWNR